MRRSGLVLLSLLAATGCEPPALLAPTILDAGPAPGPAPDAGTSPGPVTDAGVEPGGCRCPDLPVDCAAAPIGVPLFSSERNRMQRELLNLVRCAERRLAIAVYEVSWGCVVDALLARLEAAPELRVDILFDDDRCPREAGRLTCDLARLEGHPRVTIGDDGRSRYMHHKFVLADDARVWVSSANLTRESFCEDLNDALIVEEPAVVAAYGARFERLAVAREFGPERDLAAVVAGPYTLRFSPESPVDRPPAWYRAMLEAIAGATTSVDFMISAWTQVDLAEAMVEAHARGVRVRGLVSEVRTDDAPLSRLLAAGIPVRMDEIHSKVLVVDGRRVAAGSPNWSVNAWSNNEDSLHVDSTTVARAYLDELEALFPTARLP